MWEQAKGQSTVVCRPQCCAAQIPHNRFSRTCLHLEESCVVQAYTPPWGSQCPVTGQCRVKRPRPLTLDSDIVEGPAHLQWSPWDQSTALSQLHGSPISFCPILLSSLLYGFCPYVYPLIEVLQANLCPRAKAIPNIFVPLCTAWPHSPTPTSVIQKCMRSQSSKFK